MAWKTPTIVEVQVGMEINMYACAARTSLRYHPLGSSTGYGPRGSRSSKKWWPASNAAAAYRHDT
jgi:coenzyme PQQ precursor peptide PqqA